MGRCHTPAQGIQPLLRTALSINMGGARFCVASLATIDTSPGDIWEARADLLRDRAIAVLQILENTAALLGVPCPSALATLEGGPRGWSQQNTSIWPSRSLWPACRSLQDWALDLTHPMWRLGQVARSWTVRNQCIDHWSFLFFHQGLSYGSEAVCTLCGISFTPPLTHALSHHSRTCPETLYADRQTDQGRGSLLTCGDIEENPGPEERDVAHLLGILADAAPGPPILDNNTGQPIPLLHADVILPANFTASLLCPGIPCPPFTTAQESSSASSACRQLF